MDTYLKVEAESGKKFYQDFSNKGKVLMLNLLKFRTIASYSSFETLKPSDEITGKEAYQLYIDYTLPVLESIGSKVVFYGNCSSFLIGPESEKWDAVLLVEYESVERFMAFIGNKEYLKTAGHRFAALEDSRLLPISESDSYK